MIVKKAGLPCVAHTLRHTLSPARNSSERLRSCASQVPHELVPEATILFPISHVLMAAPIGIWSGDESTHT